MSSHSLFGRSDLNSYFGLKLATDRADLLATLCPPDGVLILVAHSKTSCRYGFKKVVKVLAESIAVHVV